MSTGLRMRDVFHAHPRGLRPGEREVAVPAFFAVRLVKGAVAGLVASGAYLVTLLTLGPVVGRSPVYPLRAIYAIFNGNRYLDGYAIFPLDYGWFELVKSLVWVASLGVIFALPLALFAPGRVLRSTRAALWVPIAVVWAATVFVVGFVLLGYPAPPNVQRAGSSFQGVREVGEWVFAAAQLAYAVMLGLLLRRATCTTVVVREYPDGPAPA